MKDKEIFNILEQTTGISVNDVSDFRSCNSIYTEFGIPDIQDAILIKLKNNGTLLYVPDKDMTGKSIQRKQPEKKLNAKIVIQDGIIEGVFMNKAAKEANLILDIVDADSEFDTEDFIRQELMNPDMIELTETLTKHPDKRTE